MEVYFTEFIKLMDKKKKNWQKDHVIMMDNAPYHTSKQMMQFYKEQ